MSEELDEEQCERLSIGKRIAMLRAENGLTQQELALRTGVKREHISRIETGKYSVGLDILAKVAKTMNTNVDFI